MFSNASNLAAGVDKAFFLILLVSIMLLVLVTFLMVYFIFKYSRKKNPSPKDIKGNTLLEVTWIVIPTILVLGMFYYGWVGFRPMREVPKDAMTVKVTARMWAWSFEYENGKRSVRLRIPVGKNVKLYMNSKDVLHSLFVPAFRVKEDLVPGQETYMWFVSNRVGTYDIFCAEYCGVGHSGMGSKVIVMPAREFDQWYNATEGEPWKAEDGALLVEKNGCLECHSIDGSRRLGPTFKGLFGTQQRVISRGEKRRVLVDEAYLRKAILEPNLDVVEGYQPIMPSMEGLLSEKEVEAIILYLKGLK